MILPSAQFDKAKTTRKSLSLSNKVQQLCAYIEHTVKGDGSMGLVCCGNSNQPNINQGFKRAFQLMSKEDQMEYYIYIVEYAQNSDAKPKYEPEEEFSIFEGFVRDVGSFSNSWHKSRVEVSSAEAKITLISNKQNDKIETISLRHFLIRKSKARGKFALALEAVHQNMTIRIGFRDWSVLNKCYNVLMTIIMVSHVVGLFDNKKPGPNSQESVTGSNIAPKTVAPKLIPRTLSLAEADGIEVTRSITGALMEKSYGGSIKKILLQMQTKMSQGPQGLRNNKYTTETNKNQTPNIFVTLMPQYQLEKLQSEANYRLLRFNSKHRILQHKVISNKFKLIAMMPIPKQALIQVVSNPLSYPSWNPQVQLTDIKLRLASQNTIIVYQLNKAYSEFHYPRDFLYVRHMFNYRKKTYMLDKSIQNAQYPPFNKVVRGQINHGLWMMEEMGDGTMMYVEIQVVNKGKMDRSQEGALAIRYMEGISGLKTGLQNKFQKDLFRLDWDITQSQKKWQDEEKNSILRAIDQDDSQSESVEGSVFNMDICQQIEEFYTIEDQYSEGEMLNQNLIRFDQEIIHQETKQIEKPSIRISFSQTRYIMNQQGVVMVPNTYLHKRHKMNPFKCEYIKSGSYPWGRDWTVYPDGIARYVDRSKLRLRVEAKYAYRTHILNGSDSKNNTNVSMPIDAYGQESFLSMMAKNLGSAPKFLYLAGKQTNPVQRFKQCLVFGLNNSMAMALQMIYRPFAPLLGQTFQGWLHGCPVYCEQINLQPPITSVLLIGRGFTVSGSLECRTNITPKKESHVNTGCFKIQFKDGQKIEVYRSNFEFSEASGQDVGEKHMRLTGKCKVLDRQNLLYGEIVFNTFISGDQFPDTIRGCILKVTPRYIQDLETNKDESQDESKRICTVDGRWTSHLDFDTTRYYTVESDVPCAMEQQKYPLASHSNYRADIICQKQEDYPRAQIHNQRLEDMQIRDQKRRDLRQR